MVDIIASYYESLKENKEKKQLFFTFLAEYLGPNHEDISNSAEKVVELYKQVNTDNHHIKMCCALQNHIMISIIVYFWQHFIETRSCYSSKIGSSITEVTTAIVSQTSYIVS